MNDLVNWKIPLLVRRIGSSLRESCYYTLERCALVNGNEISFTGIRLFRGKILPEGIASYNATTITGATQTKLTNRIYRRITIHSEKVSCQS